VLLVSVCSSSLNFIDTVKKFYQPTYDEDHRHMVVVDYERADFDITSFWHGVPYDGALPSNIRLYVNASKPVAPDFLANPISWPICSDRLVRVLQQRSYDLQLFDAPLFDRSTNRRIGGYSIVNVTRLIACLDFAKSNISYADDSDEIISVIDSVFIESQIPPDTHIFRVAEDTYSVVISDELADDLARERITGIVLLKCLAF
jgi:hypothetical protein